MKAVRLLFLTLFFFPALTWAQGITFEGELQDSGSSPITYNSTNFTFEITDPAGSCILYRETQNGIDLSLTSGKVSLIVGTGTQTYIDTGSGISNFYQVFDNTLSFSNGTECPGTFSPTAQSHRKLRVTVNDGTFTETLTDIAINPASLTYFAMKASDVDDSAITSAKILDGTIATVDVANGAISEAKLTNSCASGQVLKSDGAGNFTCANDDTGSVGAGTITATELATDAVTTAKILDGSVTTTKISAGVDAVKIGTGVVDNTEFGYLDTVTSNIQTQLNSKAMSPLVPADISSGSAVSPSIAASTDSNTGLYWGGGGILGISSSGVAVGEFNSSGLMLASGAVVNEFSIDSTLSGASNIAIPTELAVKTYVDAAVAGVSLWTDNGSYLSTIGDTLQISGGTVAVPAYSFSGDGDTGFYSYGVDQIGISLGGAVLGRFESSGLILDPGTFIDAPVYRMGTFPVLSAPGTNNLLVGKNAGPSLTGSNNTMVGPSAGNFTTAGSNNTYVGRNAASNATTANYNTVIGANAGAGLTGGSNNTILGFNAGSTLSTGTGNILIGNTADVASPTDNNTLVIANGTNTFIYGDASGKIGIGTTAPAVALDVNGLAKIVRQPAAPTTCMAGLEGAIGVNSSNNKLCICDGSTWRDAQGTSCGW